MAAEGSKTVILVRKRACKCRLMLLQLFTERLLMNLLKEVVTEPRTPVCYRHNSFLLISQWRPWFVGGVICVQQVVFLETRTSINVRKKLRTQNPLVILDTV